MSGSELASRGRRGLEILGTVACDDFRRLKTGRRRVPRVALVASVVKWAFFGGVVRRTVVLFSAGGASVGVDGLSVASEATGFATC